MCDSDMYIASHVYNYGICIVKVWEIRTIAISVNQHWHKEMKAYMA